MSRDNDHDNHEGGAQAQFESELRRAAASSATVLIEGEFGSGKSSIAQRLHASSPRAHGPFVVVDLAALPGPLLEAELFGHTSGAFTGAKDARLGRFRRANSGTIVLEGIENLPLPLQVKLLRVLQERAVEPLGSEETEAIDVRVLATSSLSLQAEVERGRFRQDLYWRLAVVLLRVPPLRARMAELDRIVPELARSAAERSGVALRRLSSEALERLRRHPWPGNLRELENALERVLVLGRSATAPIQAAELAFLDEALTGAAHRLAAEALAHGIHAAALEEALLECALREHRGNQSAAARALGLSRRAFEYRLQRHRSGAGADRDGEEEA